MPSRTGFRAARPARACASGRTRREAPARRAASGWASASVGERLRLGERERLQHAPHKAQRRRARAQRADAQPDQQRRHARVGRDLAADRDRQAGAVGGVRRLPDEREHGRVERAVQARHHVVAAVDGERELRQVVGADREKVDVLGKAVGEQRHGGHLDHDAQRQVGAVRDAVGLEALPATRGRPP